MRASLISREVIADSIELMVHAHDFDALVCLVGCDKTVPAALMALARVDKPAVVVYGGPMRAGHWNGREVTIQDVWEAVGAYERGGLAAGRAGRARAAWRARARAPAPATSPPTRWRWRSTASASPPIGHGLAPAVDLEAKDDAAGTVWGDRSAAGAQAGRRDASSKGGRC